MSNSDQKEKQYILRPGVYIYLRGSFWILRYRIPVEVNGKRQLRDQYKKLARREEYSSPRSVEHLAKPYLDSLPGKMTTAATQTVATFIEHTYFPHVEQEKVLAPSTISGYRHIFTKHLKKRLGNTALCDFSTATGYKLLNQISKEAKLSRTSLKHIKWFMAAVFKLAKNVDAYRDANPIPDVEIPQGPEGADTHAYSLEEICTMLAALTDQPLANAVVATAAFTGLRRSELRGLRWEDLRDNQLHVTRTVWNATVRDKTKTAESKAPVPVLPVLAQYLEDHRNGFPADGFIFAGQKLQRPLNLANLARRIIVPALRESGVKCWTGWHGFRRGLATNLYELGIEESTIQAILRHADVETTRKHYIKKNVVPEASKAAMKKLETVFKTMRKSIHAASGLGTNVGTKRSHKTKK